MGNKIEAGCLSLADLKLLRQSAANPEIRKIVDKLAAQQRVGVDKRLTQPLSPAIQHRHGRKPNR